MQNTDISQIALQQSEDNKKEIINIYSKLKQSSTKIEEINNQVQNLINNGDEDNKTVTPCVQYRKTLNYAKHYETVSKDDFNLSTKYLYSECDQFTPISFKLNYLYSGSSSKFVSTIIDIEALVNGVVVARTTSTCTNHQISVNVEFSGNCTLKNGLNEINIKFAKRSESLSFRVGLQSFTIDCANAYFLEPNGNNFDVIYKDDNTYYMFDPYNEFSTSYVYNQFDITNTTPDIYDTGYKKSSRNNCDRYCFNVLRRYNSETGKFEFFDIGQGASFVGAELYVHRLLNSKSISVTGSSKNRLYAFGSSYDPTFEFKCVYLLNTNLFYLFEYDPTKTICLKQDKTEYIENPQDIIMFKNVNIIDEDYNINRDLCFIATYKDQRNVLYYLVNGEFKKVEIGYGINPSAYYYQNGIIVFLRNKHSMNMHKFNYENGEYIFESSQYVGSYENIMLANKNLWFTTLTDNTVTQIPSILE